MKSLVASIIALAILGTLKPAIGQTASVGDVSKRSIRLEMRGVGCPEIISAIAMLNKLPTGFQQRSGAAAAEAEKKRDVLFPNSISVGMLMTFLMPDCPGYSWSGGSVLSVFPTPKEDSVLDVVIPQFAAEDLNPAETLDRIFETPEVKKYLKEKNLSRSTGLKGLTSAVPDSGKYRFIFSNKSVRDMLNDIVVTTGYKIWIHQGPAGQNRTINLGIF
jgi:hypothetical protein